MRYKVEVESWYCPDKMEYDGRYYYVKDGAKVRVSRDDLKIEKGQWIYESKSETNNPN